MDQAETLRNIIKLQNQRTVTNARVITVTSGKGGVGKSNTSINLALQFQKMGKRDTLPFAPDRSGSQYRSQR